MTSIEIPTGVSARGARWLRPLIAVAIVLAGTWPATGPSPRLQARARPVSVDDLMALATINDVEIAPAGDRVAYTVSTPALASNTHETATVRAADRRWHTHQAGRGRAGLRARPAGPARALVSRRRGDLVPRNGQRAAAGVRRISGGRASAGRNRCPGGRERLRVVTRRDEGRVPRSRAGSASDRVQSGREPAARHPALGAGRGCRRLGSCADVHGSLRGQFFVEAGRRRDRLLLVAHFRLHGALRHAHRRRHQRRARHANDRRSPGHERSATVLAGRRFDLVRLDRRARGTAGASRTGGDTAPAAAVRRTSARSR